MYSPLEQFKIVPYIRVYDNLYDLSITNFTTYIIISITIILLLIRTRRRIVSSKKEIIGEVIYKNIDKMIKDMIGKSKYIPIIYSIFLLILFNNILGLIPYSMTITSHILYSIYISICIVCGVTIIGINKHGYKFINIFMPSGLNTGPTKYILPLIFIIEVISYASRIISLSVRLTANMISGHLILHILMNLGIHLSLLLFIIPIFILFPIYLLEIGVGLIQSYVFAILTISYIKDVEYLH